MDSTKHLPYEAWEDSSHYYDNEPTSSFSIAGACPTCKQRTNFVLLDGELREGSRNKPVLLCPLCEDTFYLKFISVL